MNSRESNQAPLTELPKASLILRFAAIGAALAGITGLFAYAGGWLTPRTHTPASMIDGFEQVNGPHPGFRRNHAVRWATVPSQPFEPISTTDSGQVDKNYLFAFSSRQE